MRPSGFLAHGLLIASVVAVCRCAGAIEGSGGCVALDAKASVFWRTAVSSEVTVPVDFPTGATAATLTVTGMSYRAQYAVEEGDFTFQLPEPSSPSTEDVYHLTLKFDDGCEREASVARVTGTSKSGSAAGVRVNFVKDSREWRRVRDCRAVLPVPYGMRSLTIDGEPVDTGLDGAAGWYMFRPAVKFRTYGLALAGSPQDVVEAALFGSVPGMYVIFR